MQMEASVWTFCKTVGLPPTMSLQFLPQSSHCWTSPTQIPQLTTWLPSFTRFDYYFSDYLGSVLKINLQENRREYEKRVASIVEASWLIFSEETDGKDDGVKGETAE